MRFAKHEWWLPKIFCLIAACALWVYVMNEQNPMVENTYNGPSGSQKSGSLAGGDQCASQS